MGTREHAVGVMQLNVGCGTHYAHGWCNIDVVCREDLGVLPDQVVPADVPLDRFFTSGSCHRVYLGHVLEHIPWHNVTIFLTGIRNVLVPGGEIMVVCPDVYRVIDRYKHSVETLWRVEACLEGDNPQADLMDGNPWDGARHHWNAHEARVIRALKTSGFVDVRGVPLDSPLLDTWPVVSRVEWQCAVHAHAPTSTP